MRFVHIHLFVYQHTLLWVALHHFNWIGTQRTHTHARMHSVAGAMGICFPYLGEFQPTKYRLEYIILLFTQ